MTVKRKLLIALLSASCLTAGAAGLSACTPDKPHTGDGITYTVTALDQNGNAVEGVVFRMGYYSPTDYTTYYYQKDSGRKDGAGNPITETVTATSDKNGKAVFKNVEAEEGVAYSAYIADPDAGRAYPYGYRNDAMFVAFDENRQATFGFKYVPSSFEDNICYALEYKRTFDDGSYDGSDESTMAYKEIGSETLTLNLKKDVHSYFYFQSYKELGFSGYTGTDEAARGERIAYNQLWATKAAAGKYKISFSAPSQTTMYSFYGSGYVYADENGIPASKLETVSGKEGNITLEFTISGYMSRAAQHFGLYSAADCEVTVTVERIGDAEEPIDIKTQKVNPPQNIESFGAQEGSLTLMTVDGSLSVVKGGDGYYRVGSGTGPLLLVNLTKALSRVGTLSIMDMADSAKNPESYSTAHIFSVYENGVLKARYDYSDFLKAYAEKANADGVYPVDEEIYTFLKLFAAKGQMLTSAGEYSYLLPCQYYMPEDGMDAGGAGTQADPYVLLGAVNKLNLDGSAAYAQFTATTDGVYTFAVNGCTLAADGGAQSFYNGDGLLHVCIAENGKVTLTVTGTGGATVTVANVTANSVAAFEGDGVDGSQDKGTGASCAIQLTKTGYTAYTVDDVCGGVWVYVKYMGSGTINYKLEVLGSSYAQLEYNGNTYKCGETFDLTCEGGESYAFFLTAKDGGNTADGIYALLWQAA